MDFEKHGKNTQNAENSNQQNAQNGLKTAGKSQKIKICISWVLVVLYLAMIFYFSGQDGTSSHKVSFKLLHYMKLLAILLPGWLQDFLASIYYSSELLLRKAAHFTEYFVLSLLFYRAMAVSGVRPRKSLAVTLVFCFLYAVSDEIHQYFVPGRAFAVTDILIDTLGAALGVAIIYIRKIALAGKKKKIGQENT
ncbi:MAG: VanZ family protein [Clostridiaceae bacterium]|nr:VanZ family protein [Clostridiaceae bacterium]